jgi:hypothetical protein
MAHRDSLRAAEVSLFAVRAFVQLRKTLGAHEDLAKPVDEFESRIERKRFRLCP